MLVGVLKEVNDLTDETIVLISAMSSVLKRTTRKGIVERSGLHLKGIVLKTEKVYLLTSSVTLVVLSHLGVGQS